MISPIRVLALVLLTASPAAAELIANGSFELEALSSPSRTSMINLEDWTNSGGFNLLERGVNGSSNVAAQDGEQFVSMGHSSASNSVLSQSIATVPGTSYSVSFWTRAIQGTGTQELTLSVRDDAIALATLPVEVSDDTQWLQSVTTFVATSAATIIEFSDTVGATNGNIALDNVSVVEVPEPASLALAACGAVAMLAFARRRVR